MARSRMSVSSDGGDDVSMLLAGVCLAHCLLAPVLAAIWPVVGVPLARAAGLHQLFAFITLVLSPLILVPGYLAHRRKVIASLGVSGRGAAVARGDSGGGGMLLRHSGRR
ncbi:MAG: MerC domain-containing protein [Planctomycetaceae bacterium]